jgi:hypothetical protein
MAAAHIPGKSYPLQWQKRDLLTTGAGLTACVELYRRPPILRSDGVGVGFTRDGSRLWSGNHELPGVLDRENGEPRLFARYQANVS